MLLLEGSQSRLRLACCLPGRLALLPQPFVLFLLCSKLAYQFLNPSLRSRRECIGLLLRCRSRWRKRRCHAPIDHLLRSPRGRLVTDLRLSASGIPSHADVASFGWRRCGRLAVGSDLNGCRFRHLNAPRSQVTPESLGRTVSTRIECAWSLGSLRCGHGSQRCTTTLRSVPGSRARLRMRALECPIQSLGHRAPHHRETSPRSPSRCPRRCRASAPGSRC